MESNQCGHTERPENEECRKAPLGAQPLPRIVRQEEMHLGTAAWGVSTSLDAQHSHVGR